MPWIVLCTCLILFAPVDPAGVYRWTNGWTVANCWRGDGWYHGNVAGWHANGWTAVVSPMPRGAWSVECYWNEDNQIVHRTVIRRVTGPLFVEYRQPQRYYPPERTEPVSARHQAPPIEVRAYLVWLDGRHVRHLGVVSNHRIRNPSNNPWSKHVK